MAAAVTIITVTSVVTVLKVLIGLKLQSKRLEKQDEPCELTGQYCIGNLIAFISLTVERELEEQMGVFFPIID